ncbi:MAG: hypothetical protein JEZ07_08965 [Phycisphaerae bacterium]|nr:hypothetical protein [Phycisphaerae bacterium]
MMETIWTILNSPMGIGFAASVVLFLLNLVYSKKPNWRNFEGTIIAAIKYAEKSIPDDASNKGLLKLDKALGYTIGVYEQVSCKRVTQQVKDNLREGIQIKHAELEIAGALAK